MKLKSIVTVFIISAIFLFLFWNIKSNWQLIIGHNWMFSPTSIFLVLIFLLPIYLINATSWHLINVALGSTLTYTGNLKVWLYSNLGRFLPGTIWQYAGRIYLASSQGISKPLTTTALIAEAIFNLLAGVIVVFLSLLFTSIEINKNVLQLLTIVAIILVPVILILSNNKIISILIKLIGKLLKYKDIEIRPLPFRSIPVLLFSYLLQFVFGGLTLFFLSKMAIDLPINLYPVFIGIFAISWLLGYISFVSPSGIGIQELSLAGLLSIYMPFSIAIVVAIIFRVTLLIAELLTIGALQLSGLISPVKVKNLK